MQIDIKRRGKWLAQWCLGIVLVIVPMVLYAQLVDEAPSQPSDVLTSIVNIVQNWKGMTAIGVISAFVVLLVQVAKVTFLESLWEKWGTTKKHAFIVCLGVISQILVQVVKGSNWTDALIGGLVTGGGAIAIYEGIAGVFKAPPAPPKV